MESAPSRSRDRNSPTERGNTQNRHSNSRSPSATTEIFNSPLNLTEKGQLCQSRNSSEYLANAPFCSRFLSPSRVFYSFYLLLLLLSR
nr:MAG TPA: hypothetical protein [Bacteriophage sp.]